MSVVPIEWINFNLSNSIGRYDNREWQTLFAITTSILSLWYNRNKHIFEGKISITAGALKQIWYRSAEIKGVFNLHGLHGRTVHVDQLVQWQFPPTN